MKAALVFPGQGSQAVGMGEALARDFPAAREALAAASAAVGFDLASLCFTGPPDKLALTQFTQPCVLAASIAAFRVMQTQTGIAPALAAGHSLGEYSALVAAGALPLAVAALAVHRRGQWMQEAAPAGQGAMAAVMGLDPGALADVCREAAQGQVVVPANDNAPGQVVVSGHAEAVERACALVKAKGGKCRKLNVSGPFHTPLMEPAAVKMEALLAGIAFHAPDFPVLANYDAAPYHGPGEIADRLRRQIVSPVRWRETVRRMADDGVELFIEVGPGTVLAGLITRTVPGAKVLPMNDPQHLDAIAKALA